MRHRAAAVAAVLALTAAGVVPLATAASATTQPATSTGTTTSTTVPIATRLAPVTGLRTAPAPTGQRLHWTNPTSTELVGLVVRRSPGRTAPTSPTTGAAVATLTPATSSMIDTSVEPHAVYSYAVFAMYSGNRHASAAIARAASPASITPTADTSTGSFTGTVTDTLGYPLGNVEVLVAPSPAVVVDQGFGFSRFYRLHHATTAADGTFTINHIGTASYQICYIASDRSVSTGDGSLLGYADNCPSDAIEGHAGTVTHLPEVQLSHAAQGGVIAGKVVAADTGLPLSGVQVSLQGVNPLFVATGANGTFRFSVPAGQYEFCFDATFVTQGTGYISTCSQQPVVVTAGQVTHTQQPLQIGGAVTGVAQLSVDGSPVVYAEVDAYQEDGGYASTVTDDQGRYTLDGLSSSRAHICVEGFFSQPTPSTPEGLGSACTARRPAPGKTVNAPNLVVDPAGGVSGTVTTRDGRPMGGAVVAVQNRFGGVTTTTNPDGTYEIPWLTAGTYYFCALAATYPVQCWDHRTPDRRPTPITVTAGQLTTGIDASLDGGAPGRVRLTVTDSHGTPLIGANAVLLQHCLAGQPCDQLPITQRHASTVATGGLTGADGSVLLTGIAPGHYAMCGFGRYAVGGSSTTRYQDACNDSSYSITVTSGATATGSISLLDGGAVAGTVDDTQKRVVPGVVVYASTGDDVDTFGFQNVTLSGNDGRYLIKGLPAGTTTICFDASLVGGPSLTGYANECYQHRLVGSTPVPVTNGQITYGIDADLRAGAVITGTVTDAGGEPIADAEVIVNGQYTGYDVQTGPDGTYRAVGLTPGTYTVCFYGGDVPAAPPTGFVDQCYQNATYDTATPVTVRAGRTTAGIDAVLAEGAEFTGTVSADGAPVDFVGVVLFQHTPAGWTGYGTGTQAGTYDFKGVAPGSYVICVDASFTDYASQCYNGVAWRGGGHLPPSGTTKVTGAAGQVVTTDFALDPAS